MYLSEIALIVELVGIGLLILIGPWLLWAAALLWTARVERVIERKLMLWTGHWYWTPTYLVADLPLWSQFDPDTHLPVLSGPVTWRRWYFLTMGMAVVELQGEDKPHGSSTPSVPEQDRWTWIAKSIVEKEEE